MKIAVDKNQLTGSHGKSNAKKHNQMVKMGHELVATPIPFGDYCMITDQMQETIDRRGDKLKKADLVGDIKVSVDTKKDLLEVCGNICSSSHNRFRDEVILAQKCGCKLYVLVEEPGVTCIEDVFKWVNPRLMIMEPDFSRPPKYVNKYGKAVYFRKQKYPKATRGKTLALAMTSMESRYGCEFRFCTKDNAGEEIIRILTEENENEAEEG